MRIGIIGAGNIGGALAHHFVRAGHEVAVANSRGPETLADFVAELGERAQAVTAPDAARVAIPISGDDAEAKRVVAGLIDGIGFDAVDAGTLAEGGRKHQRGTPVYTEELSAEELREALAAI